MIFQMVRGTAEALARKNPVFRSGEPVFEMDTRKFKIGDGATPYNALPYYFPGNAPDGSDDTALLAHIASETPHPAYDDGPSLVLLYENAKV